MDDRGDWDTQHFLHAMKAASGAALEQARNALLDHASGRLQRLARTMLRGYPRLQRWEQTDDVLQNALLRLHQALSRVRPDTPREFYGLAALQIRRELIDLSRHHFGPQGDAAKHRTAVWPDAGQAIDAATEHAGESSDLAAWQAFHEEVGRLPDAEREVVHLLWYQGLKQQQAAELLGVTERTVKNRWRRARLLLQQTLHHGDWLENATENSSSAADARREIPLPEVFARRYQRETLIAAGGFSQVWRATDLESGQAVAIKVTSQDCLAEARRVARLQHHGIVTVRDSGHQERFCFIVFDLVDGGDLAELLSAGPLPWRRAGQVIAEAASRLDFAHRQGFVHRDIKPANILIGADGRVVLADFGIAVTREELLHETLTTAGTLAYMAPEQLLGRGAVDARADIHALGVVFYEALAGRRPFQAAALAELRRQILEDIPPAPSRLIAGAPAELDRICLRCLAKAPGDRFQTAAELSAELHQAVSAS